MVDLSVICRTCMKNTVNLFNLFSHIKIEDSYDVLLADLLMTTTVAQVQKEDGLPQKICGDCVNVLQTIVTFRSNVLKVQEQLKKLIYPTEILKEEPKDEEAEESIHFEAAYEEIEICPISFLPKEEGKSEVDLYECDRCEKWYTTQADYLNHLTGHEKKCDKKLESDKVYSIENNLVKSEENKNVYACKECNQTFSKERSLMAHGRKHRNFKRNSNFFKFECDYCGKVFSMKTVLRRHIMLHFTERPYLCKLCPKSYTRPDQLQEHVKRHDRAKTHVCSYCNKGFFQLCSLKDHLRVHTKETPFLCSTCGKSFTNNSNLRQHLLRHSGLKPFACTFCPKKFATKGQMASHVITHTDVHPYKCDECDSRFTNSNSLKKHKVIHLGIRAFTCETCQKSFKCKDHLKRHQRIHTGEKPYRCKYCERAFSQSYEMVKHMRKHVGQNIYQCTVCNMKFRLMRELKKHYPTHYVKGEKAPIVPIGRGVAAPILVEPTFDPQLSTNEIALSITDMEVVWQE